MLKSFVIPAKVGIHLETLLNEISYKSFPGRLNTEGTEKALMRRLTALKLYKFL